MKEVLYTAYLEGSLRLSEQGVWYHNGRPFQNEKLSVLFHRSIVWDERQSRYFIQIGAQRATFDLDDTAYFVVSLKDEKLPWGLILADTTEEQLRPNTLKLGEGGKIYTEVKGDHRAVFTRGAYQTLVQHLVGEDRLAVGDELISLRKL